MFTMSILSDVEMIEGLGIKSGLLSVWMSELLQLLTSHL